MITRIIIVCLLLSVVFGPSYSAIADCSDPYILNHHHLTGKLDICSIKNDIGAFEVLTNWGTKPEWLNETQFVFMSNQIGDVHLMDLETNTVTNLTGQFQHAGFTRAHKLNSGDLLLVGPESGPQPPEDPLVIYDKGQFTGSLWVFEAPFDQPPYLLKRKVTESVSFLWWQRETTRMENIPAWEGVAVSRESNLIVWSNTQTPFYGENIIETGFNYIFKPSSLWTGTFVHRPGSSYMESTRKIVSKCEIGSVFLEPQNFIGEDDTYVSFTAYGPTSSGSGNSWLYDFKNGCIIREYTGPGYDEWEGVAPDYQKSFVEIDEDASAFEGPVSVELHLYDFSKKTSTRFTYFHGDHQRADGFSVHEPVFSPSGRYALFATLGGGGWEFNSPGYSIGIVLLDVEAYLSTLP